MAVFKRRAAMAGCGRLAKTMPLVLVLAVAGCGGGGGGGAFVPTTSGTVTTHLSDPPSCKATLDHAWVTIADVKANLNPDAGAGDSGFVDLTPDLASAP